MLLQYYIKGRKIRNFLFKGRNINFKIYNYYVWMCQHIFYVFN